MHLDMKVKAWAKDIFTQKPVFFRFSHGSFDIVLHPRRIMTGVDKSLMWAHSIGADDQTFQHAVWISRKDGSIHERPQFPFMSVDDNVLFFPGGITGGLPLPAGRESTAAPAAQIGFLDFFQNFFRTHLEKRFG